MRQLPAAFLRRDPEPIPEPEPFGTLPETPFARPSAPLYQPPRVTVYDPCHLCHHGFHGLPCRVTTCHCQSAWTEQ